jgi:hypothetical protein
MKKQKNTLPKKIKTLSAKVLVNDTAKGGGCWTECDAIGGFIMWPYTVHCVRYCEN